MVSVEITIRLPETLAKQASLLGLLSSEHIALLLAAEIEAQLRAMSADPAIQHEIQQIEAEFQSTETDGLDSL
jgi:hypothetical protein